MTKGWWENRSSYGLIFYSKTSYSLDTQTPELKEEGWVAQLYLHNPGEIVSELLHHLAYGPWWHAPEDTEEAGKVLTGPLSVICQQSWISREITAGWKDVPSTYMKGWKEDLSNYRPVSQTLVPEKATEQGGMGCPECHGAVHAGQPGHQGRPALV